LFEVTALRHSALIEKPAMDNIKPPTLTVITGGLERIERQLLECLFGPDLEKVLEQVSDHRPWTRPDYDFLRPRQRNLLKLVGGTATVNFHRDR
jgi:hypothetical protein